MFSHNMEYLFIESSGDSRLLTLKNAINADFTKSFYLMNHLYDAISYKIKLAVKVEQRIFID